MNRNVPEPGNPVIVRKRNKKNDPGTGSGKTGMGTTNGRSKGMEQEHGTDAAAICKGVLLRIGMAAAMSTAVLGFISYQVLPRLRKMLSSRLPLVVFTPDTCLNVNRVTDWPAGIV